MYLRTVRLSDQKTYSPITTPACKWLSHQFTLKPDSSWRFWGHWDHLCGSCSLKYSSMLNFSWHRPLQNQPAWENTWSKQAQKMIDIIYYEENFSFVIDFSSRFCLNPKVSNSMHHTTLKVFSVGRVAEAQFFTSAAISLAGTSKDLLPDFLKICCSSLMSYFSNFSS